MTAPGRRLRALAACALLAAALAAATPTASAAETTTVCTFRAEVGAVSCTFPCQPGQTLVVRAAGIGVTAESACGGAAVACAGPSYCEAASLMPTLEAGRGTCVVTGAVWYAWCEVG